MLNNPLTEEGLLLALKQAPNGKSPGTDGLPSEVYGRYATQTLPTLLKVYNGALESGKLPQSMNKAKVFVLLKPGKDALLVDSYRPISLFNIGCQIIGQGVGIETVESHP